MTEIHPDFSFPLLAPPSDQAPPRSRSAGNGRAGRVHAHRRSGAVSEDFDVLSTTKPPLTCPSSPTAVSKHQPSTPRSPETPFYGQSLYTMSASSLSSESTAFSESVSRRISFAPPSPRRSPHMGDIGEPGPTFVQRNDEAVQANGRKGRDESKRHSKRSSFVKLFKRNKQASKTTASTTPPPLPPLPSNPDQCLPKLSASLGTPAPTSPTVRFSPRVTPRHSSELDPELPCIDLNEALSSSFAHRRTQSLPSALDSPFSKGAAASSIGPVMEEEDGAEDEPLSLRQKRYSVLSLGIPEPPSAPDAPTNASSPEKPASRHGHRRRRSILDRIFSRK